MARFSTQLSGSHVLVTGGTKGIGRAIVEAFLSEGANVSYCARSVRGDDFAQFKNAVDGARAVGTSVDISSQSSVEAWVESAAQKFGRIDVVVANATPFFTDATRECWQQAFQADILGLITLIEATTPHLVQRPRTGSIIIISSLAGFESRHPSLTGPYATFKRAQATLAKEYARKLGPQGVRINAIVPGAIETPSVTRPDGTVEQTTFQLLKRDNPSFYKSLLDSIPMGRTGAVDEVANVVVFLGSPLASYVSGAHLALDGAMSVIL